MPNAEARRPIAYSGQGQMRGSSAGRSCRFDMLAPRDASAHPAYFVYISLYDRRNIIFYCWLKGKSVLHQVHRGRHVILSSHLVLPLSEESPSPPGLDIRQRDNMLAVIEPFDKQGRGYSRQITGYSAATVCSGTDEWRNLEVETAAVECRTTVTSLTRLNCVNS